MATYTGAGSITSPAAWATASKVSHSGGSILFTPYGRHGVVSACAAAPVVLVTVPEIIYPIPDISLWYEYGPTPDQGIIISDLVDVLVGTATQVSDLGCIDGSLTINIGSSWMLYDANAGTGKVVKATSPQGGGIYLWVGAVQGGIDMIGYSAWDPVSHTGVMSDASPTQPLSEGGGTLLLVIDPDCKAVVLMSVPPLEGWPGSASVVIGRPEFIPSPVPEIVYMPPPIFQHWSKD